MTTASQPTEDTPRAAPTDLGAPSAWLRGRVAILISAVALVATANAVGLFEPTETRYAEVAREMHATGDFLIPRLAGVPHFSKPPFAYWATAIGFALFGVNGWGARLPVALAGAATLGLAGLAVRRRFAALGVAAGPTVWMLATMALPFALGRSVATDPFLAAAVTAFWAFAPSPAAIVMLGVGFLIKGPVVFIPTLLPVLVVAAWQRSRAPLRWLGPGWSWLPAAAVALPWYAIALARTPGLLHYLLDYQIWQRYTTHVHHRSGAPWYFAAVLVAGAMPWTVALVAGLHAAWRERDRVETRLLLAWLIAPIVFFSFSGSKLPAYILPCFPAAAALGAVGLARGGGRVRVGTAVTLLVMVTTAVFLAPRLLAAPDSQGGLSRLALWLAVALGAWTLAAIALIGHRLSWAMPLVLAGWVAVIFGAAPYEATLGSPRPLVRQLQSLRQPGQPVVEYKRFNAGLPFYLNERVRLLDVERETTFLPAAEHADVYVAPDSITALVERRGAVWLLAPPGEGEALAGSLGLDYQPTTRWRDSSLGRIVAKPAP